MQVPVAEKGKVESMFAYAPVSLKPFHIFVDDEDRTVLINPEEMRAIEIDAGTAEFLKTISQTANAVPSAADREALAGHGVRAARDRPAHPRAAPA